MRGQCILVIPPGRVLVRGAQGWSIDEQENVHATKREGAPVGPVREECKEDFNRFPIHVWLYTPLQDTTAANVSHSDLQHLAQLLADFSKPMSNGKEELPILWTLHNKATDMSLRNFPLGGTGKLPTDAMANEQRRCDGVGDVVVTEYYAAQGMKSETAIRIAANHVAGKMHDVVRIFEPLVAARAIDICAAMGATVGSMRTPHHDRGSRRRCECCDETTTVGWTVPPTHENAAVALAGSDLQRRAIENLRKQELNKWRALGIGGPPPRVEVVEAARAEAEKLRLEKLHARERMERQARRNGEQLHWDIDTDSDDEASEPPSPPEREGPRDFLDFIDRRFRDREMRCCFRCAAPIICTMRRVDEGDMEISDADALWIEVCALAQGAHRMLKSVEAIESRWPKESGDIFKRGQYEQLKGQRVQETMLDGSIRKGTVILVWRDEVDSSQPAAFIYFDPAEGRQQPRVPKAERWSIPRTIEARANVAAEVQQKHAEQAELELTFDQIPQHADAPQFIEISSHGTSVYTARLMELFNGPWCGVGPNFKPPTVTLWKRKDGAITARQSAKKISGPELDVARRS